MDKNNKNKKNRRNTEKQKSWKMRNLRHTEKHIYICIYIYLYLCVCVCLEKVNKYFTTLSPHSAARKSASQRLFMHPWSP